MGRRYKESDLQGKKLRTKNLVIMMNSAMAQHFSVVESSCHERTL
jgi:hypothetical protein